MNHTILTRSKRMRFTVKRIEATKRAIFPQRENDFDREEKYMAVSSANIWVVKRKGLLSYENKPLFMPFGVIILTKSPSPKKTRLMID